MLTAQRLFGDVTSPSLTSHTVFLERASRETRAGRKTTSDLALGGYIVARLVDTLLELDETADSRDAFRWQLEVASKYVRELPEDDPVTSHLVGIIQAVPIDGASPVVLAVSLTAYAYLLEYDAQFEEALDILALSARTHGNDFSPADFAAYALLGGKLNRLLARWKQALACYQAAEEAGRLIEDHAIILRARLHQGAVARGQGNLPKARAVAEEVAQEATQRGLAQVQCMAYTDLSAVYSLQGSPLEGIRAGYAAFLVATTTTDRLNALGDLGIGLAEIGAYEQARLAFEIVANAKTDFRIRVNAVIELMDLESLVENRVAFERHRIAAEALRDRMPPSMLVDYYCKVGIGRARFGQLERARADLARALETAEVHALNAWYFRIDDIIRNLSTRTGIEKKVEAPVEVRQAPVIHQVELGLREYHAAVSA